MDEKEQDEKQIEEDEEEYQGKTIALRGINRNMIFVITY